MRIGVYMEHGVGNGVGGAELMMAYLASVWSRQHDVDLIHHRPPLTRERLSLFSTDDYSRIDIQAALKEKIGVDFRPYLILGACNPALAHEALKLEDKVGTMLPCNVVVQELDAGRSEVAAIDPVASMQAIDNAELQDKAGTVRQKLADAIERL